METQIPQIEPYCGNASISFSQYYAANIAGYADISICIIGSIFNIFNLLIFMRKNISPVGLIFTHLSFVHLIMLIAAIPHSWYLYFYENKGSVDKKWAYEWLWFGSYCSDFLAVMRSISVWLTIMLTVWRYIAAVYPLKEPDWCNMKITKSAIVFGYLLCTVLCIPFFCSHYITIKTTDKGREYDFKFKPEFYEMIFIINAVVFKLIPSVMLTVISCRLVVNLLASKNHHDTLTISSKSHNMARNIRMKQKVDRSTKILLAVLALFLIAELPMGTLGLLNVIYGYGINHECYDSIGVIFDTMILFDTSITFVVYYVMSQQFRTSFKSLFNLNNSFSREKDTLLRKISRNTITSQI